MSGGLCVFGLRCGDSRGYDKAMTTTTAQNAPKLIKSRRCCIGCGMRPGWIYGNGLCDRCQFPDRTHTTEH